MIVWWRIILLTTLTFWMILDQLTLVTINSPLLIGMISRIIMGDIKTGLAVGSTLQLMVLSVSTYGGAGMPDFMTGATVRTVYAVLTNKSTQFAIGLAVPVGLLMVQLDVSVHFFNTIFQHKMEQAIRNNNTKVASRNAYLGFLAWGLSRAIPVFILLVIGNDVVKAILRVVPVWLTNGLKVSGGILPVVGITILLRYLPTKKFISYLTADFLAAAYLKMPMLSVALLGAVPAILNYKRENTPTMQINTTSYENAEGEYED